MSAVSQNRATVQPFELLLKEDQIAQRVAELGAKITSDYAAETPILIGVLKGCVVFLADLMRQINLPMEVEFISAASYRRGLKQEAETIFSGGVEVEIKGRHLLLVEGVVDTARTVTTIMEKLAKEEPASLEIVTLLDKPGSHRSKVRLKYKGFTIGNDFVIGYGLDNTQRYRNLPFVGRMIER